MYVVSIGRACSLHPLWNCEPIRATCPLACAPPCAPCMQVLSLLAIQRGYADSVAPSDMHAWLAGALSHVRSLPAGTAALAEIAKTQLVTAGAEKALHAALEAYAIRPMLEKPGEAAAESSVGAESSASEGAAVAGSASSIKEA